MITAIQQDVRKKRLEELNHEIEDLRAKIARSFQDENLLLRTIGQGCEIDILNLAEERHRAEDALRNHLKEQGELQ